MVFGLKRRKAVGKVTTTTSKANDIDLEWQQQQQQQHDASYNKKNSNNSNPQKKKCCPCIQKLIWNIIKLLTKCFGSIVCIILITLCGGLAYMYGMTRYNARHSQDPCLVANNSLFTLDLLAKTGRVVPDSPELSRKVITPNGDTVTIPIDNASSSTPSLSSSGIPKIIHQQWKDQNIPHKFLKWRTKWIQNFPESEYQYILWDDESGRALIQNHYPWFLPIYDNYEHNINRVDATRYFILYHYGGIYADLDYEPLINFYKYLPRSMVGIIESPYFWNEKTQNALMSSPKGDLYWIDVFEKLIQNKHKSNILEITGPILMDQVLFDTKSQPAYILPCENFQRVPLGEYSETLPSIIATREIVFRLQPLQPGSDGRPQKHCGMFSDDTCQFGKHHNTASYQTTNGSGKGGIL